MTTLTFQNDKTGKRIAATSTENGVTKLYNAAGAIQGWYDSRNNKTFTKTGAYVGTGNQVMSLLNNSR